MLVGTENIKAINFLPNVRIFGYCEHLCLLQTFEYRFSFLNFRQKLYVTQIDIFAVLTLSHTFNLR